jgi:hypothetical protein
MDTQHVLEKQGKTRPAAKGQIQKPGAAGASPKPSVSICDDLSQLIATRAYELHVERGCRDGYALDDWLEAEREILSQVPPV